MNIIPIKSKLSRPGLPRLEGGRKSKVIAITSGKGGVGKTNVTSNLAIALARQGNRVCIFDADTNLANINVVMGLSPRYTIEHLLSGEKSVEEILLEGPEGVMIVPAASGIAECTRLEAGQRKRLLDALESLEASFDYLLIDTAAGIGESVLSFIQSAQYTILVISTEPTSLTDAFALLRSLKRRHHDRPAYVLVNMALNYANSMEIFKRFEAAVRKYLAMKVHYLGYITDDKAIKLSVSRQSPVLLNDPDALASRCFTTLAAVLSKQFNTTAPVQGFSTWWRDLAGGTPAESGEPQAATAAPAASADAAPDSDPGQAQTPAHLPTADPAHELQLLAARAHALLAEPDITPDQAERVIDPLVELYLDRFNRLPAQLADMERLLNRTSPQEAELRDRVQTIEAYFERRFGRPLREDEIRRHQEADEERERLLREYHIIAERLAAEQALLHQTLSRLYDYINDELTARKAPD